MITHFFSPNLQRKSIWTFFGGGGGEGAGGYDVTVERPMGKLDPIITIILKVSCPGIIYTFFRLQFNTPLFWSRIQTGTQQQTKQTI